MSRVRLAAAVLLFVLLGALASLGITHRADPAITTWLQRAAPTADVPAAVLVLLGDAEVVIPGVALAGLLLYARRRERGREALWLAVGLAGVSALAVALKHVVPYTGPPDLLQRHVLRPEVQLHKTPFSFPSGHTMRTTFLAGTLLRRMPLIAGALILAMMAALVYLGDHWMTDVLGGLCLGWACVEVARAVLDRPA